MTRILEQHRDDWEGLGEIDPMWAVLSHKGREGRRWNAEEFYATGRAQVEADRAALGGLGLPRSFDHILDFGCGLGRLAFAWGPHARLCTGVDISMSMIEGARRADLAPNCEFVHNDRGDLAVFEDHVFDLIYSDITLQHIPDRSIIRNYLREFVRVARPGGVIFFRLPSWLPLTLRFKVRRPLYRILTAAGFTREWLYEKFTINPMKMVSLPVMEVERILVSSGAERASVEHPNSLCTRYIFRKPPA